MPKRKTQPIVEKDLFEGLPNPLSFNGLPMPSSQQSPETEAVLQQSSIPNLTSLIKDCQTLAKYYPCKQSTVYNDHHPGQRPIRNDPIFLRSVYDEDKKSFRVQYGSQNHPLIHDSTVLDKHMREWAQENKVTALTTPITTINGGSGTRTTPSFHWLYMVEHCPVFFWSGMYIYAGSWVNCLGHVFPEQNFSEDNPLWNVSQWSDDEIDHYFGDECGSDEEKDKKEADKIALARNDDEETSGDELEEDEEEDKDYEPPAK